MPEVLIHCLRITADHIWQKKIKIIKKRLHTIDLIWKEQSQDDNSKGARVWTGEKIKWEPHGGLTICTLTKYWTEYNTQKEIKRWSVHCEDRLQTIRNETEGGACKYTYTNQRYPVGYLPAAYPVNYSVTSVTRCARGWGAGVRKRLMEEYLKNSVWKVPNSLKIMKQNAKNSNNFQEINIRTQSNKTFHKQR